MFRSSRESRLIVKPQRLESRITVEEDTVDLFATRHSSWQMFGLRLLP
jgi:hypothetical protein